MSGIMLRDQTRVATEDEIMAKANRREFIPIEKLDLLETRTKHALTCQSSGIYTIGVLTDKSPPIPCKNGKHFTIFKLTDLVKYDINRVEDVIRASLGKDMKTDMKDEVIMAKKSFTHNGYKNISFCAFGDSQTELLKLRAGTILAIINPRYGKQDVKYGISLTVESEPQIMVIGYSLDYSLCKGKT